MADPREDVANAQTIRSGAIDNDNLLEVNIDGSINVIASNVGITTMPATAAEGTSLPTVLIVIAGDDGTDTHPFQMDSNGNLKVILQANSGIDIGNVTINNAAGAAAVNIQDGGNSITVDQPTHDNFNANVNIQVGNADVSTTAPMPVSATAVQNTASNPIFVTSSNDSSVSTNNSSSTPLGISGVFTGTSEEVTGIATVSIAVHSDVASATDGLSIEFSTDGINWDHIDVYTIPAATGKIFTVGPSAKFFRTVYTNGTTAQTTFRLQSILKDIAPKPSSHRINDSISTEDDAELIKAVLTGEDNTSAGTFRNVKTDDQGRLVTAPQILSGNDTLIHKFGRQTVSVHPTVLVTHTVPSGKKLMVVSWHLQTASAITLTTLEAPVGTEVDAIRFSNSADTNRQNVNFGFFGIIEVSAGQVVQIETQTGDTAKEYIAGFTGIQTDA